MVTIEDMFASKAEAITFYQRSIKMLHEVIDIKNDDVLLLRKALRKIKENLIHYWRNLVSEGKKDSMLDNTIWNTIWDICCKALQETARSELQESCLESKERLKDE